MKLFHVYIRMIGELERAACNSFHPHIPKSRTQFNLIRGQLTHIFQIITNVDIDQNEYIISKIEQYVYFN